MKTANRKARDVFILIGMLALQLINNFIWLKIDKTLLADDPFWHHLCSHYAYSLLKSHEFFFHPLQSLGYISDAAHQYGIFVQLICAPFYFITGVGQDQSVMVNAGIFLSVLIFSVYGIAKKLADEQSGLLAAFIVSMYPIIFDHSRMFMLDLPLTAAVGLSIYFLIQSDSFSKNKYTGLFLLAFFIGILIKINFILFIFPPLLIILVKSARQFPKRSMFLIFITFILVFAMLYLTKGESIIVWLTGILGNSNFHNLSGLWRDAGIYLLLIINEGLSFWLTFTLGICLFYFLKSKLSGKFLILVSSAFSLVAVIIFLVISDRTVLGGTRYSMPILVSAAVISGIGLSKIRPRVLKILFISLVIVLSLAQFFAISWGTNFLPQNISLQTGPFRFDLLVQNMHINPARNKFSHPTKHYWDTNQIWDSIKEINNSQTKLVTVVVFDPRCETFYPLYYRAIMEAKLVDVVTVDMTEPSNKVYRRVFTLKERVLDADYVIATSRPGDDYFQFLDLEKKEAEAVFYSNIQKFELIKKYDLPDKAEALLYKNLRSG